MTIISLVDIKEAIKELQGIWVGEYLIRIGDETKMDKTYLELIIPPVMYI